jgi:hypothetical protein
MKKLLLTLLIFLWIGEYAFGQVPDTVRSFDDETRRDTVTTAHLENKQKNKQELCGSWELGANGGFVFPKVYNNMVLVKNVSNDPYTPILRYTTGGAFSARLAYHYWHLSIAAVYTYISELSYDYGKFNKNLVYYFAKPAHMFGLAANVHTTFGLYGGVNSSYVHFNYGGGYAPRVPYFVPNQPADIARAFTIGVQVGYTYTFYKGLGANAEVGMTNIPLKVATPKMFYFPIMMGLRYRFE